MSATEMRSELHQLIDQVDERFLKAVYLMVRTYQKTDENSIEDIMIPGLPGTFEEIQNSIEKGEEQIARKDYYTIDDFKNKTTQWFGTK